MKKLYEEADIQAIAEAIREKNDSTDTYNVKEMAAAVRGIGGTKTRKLTLTASRPATVQYVPATGGELISMDMVAGDEITIEVPVVSLIYITGFYTYRSGTVSGVSGWNVTGENATIDTYSHQIVMSSGTQFRYGAVAYITDISQDATVKIATTAS